VRCTRVFRTGRANRLVPPGLNEIGRRLKALHPLQNPGVLDTVCEIVGWPLTQPCMLVLWSDIRNANDTHRIFESRPSWALTTCNVSYDA
jgi:hypothetical protein